MMEPWSILRAGIVTSSGTATRSGCGTGTVTAARCAVSRLTGWAAAWPRG